MTGIAIEPTDKTLTALGIFVLITLLAVVSYHPESILAKQEGMTCKDNNKDNVCSHANSGSSKAHTIDNNKQSNSDQHNNVPFELPFP